MVGERLADSLASLCVQEPVLQSLALQDLCMLAQDPSEKWRRAAIFADETGSAWRVPVQACLKEVTLAIQPRTRRGS